MIKIIPFIYEDIDDLCANTYILIDANKKCLVVDPSKRYDGLVKYIKKNNLTLKGIILTHGHFDHFKGAQMLLNEYKTRVYVSFDDSFLLKEPKLNCSYMCGEKITLEVDPIIIKDGDKILELEDSIDVISTPFHTEGSVSYYLSNNKAIFTGDSLFKGSVGRSDLPTGNSREIRTTLNKLFKLDDDVKVYPGHGPFTTIGLERKTNPFV